MCIMMGHSRGTGKTRLCVGMCLCCSGANEKGHLLQKSRFLIPFSRVCLCKLQWCRWATHRLQQPIETIYTLSRVLRVGICVYVCLSVLQWCQ